MDREKAWELVIPRRLWKGSVSQLLADPAISDLEKIPPRSEGSTDTFADIRRRISDGEFDAMTVNLMNWYITEEKDSAQRLREAYDCVRDMAGGKRKAEADDEADPPQGRQRKKPWRYRWPDDFRNEVLARLLELNKQRAEGERLAGSAG